MDTPPGPKKKKFLGSPSTYSHAPSSSSLYNPKGLGLSLQLSGRGELQLRMTLAPPIADSLEELTDQTTTRGARTVPPDMLALVREYVQAENPQSPYTDEQILAHAQNHGYQTHQADIALARHLLGIEPSSERRKL